MMNEHEIEIIIPIQAMRDMTGRFIELINEMQARGHPMAHVLSAMWFTIGVAIRQNGGCVPDNLLLTDMQAFMDGFENGLSRPRADA